MNNKPAFLNITHNKGNRSVIMAPIKKMADVSSVPPAVQNEARYPAAAMLCRRHRLEPESVQEPPPGADQDTLASMLEPSSASPSFFHRIPPRPAELSDLPGM